jgi:adenine-specific DNA-methyltransferase
MNLSDDLTALLQQDSRLTADGQLLKNQITELALKLDKDLLRLLLSHDRLKAHFFVDVDGVLVFDRDKFVRFVNNKAFLPDSYTGFKNKIGLTTPDGRYLSESRDVVLSWPYKDCVLEGGQTQEDQKRDEIFWNEILAPDEIDRLLVPKVLTNWKRYDADGKHPVTDFAETDNLIIRGNNLLALYSLEKRFAGKVKMIYIDPPYNTGSDSFGYNDRFNHSTWLTFMRNRLEAAKTLLNSIGCIFIQLDDNEIAYCKVLLDEVFGRENYCNQIAIATNSPFGYKSTADTLFRQAGYLLLYAKDKKSFRMKKLFMERGYDPAYRYIFRDISIPEGEWEWEEIGTALARELGYKDKRSAIQNLSQDRFDAALADFAIRNAERVFQTAAVTGGAYQKRKETIEKSAKIKNKILRHPDDDMDYLFIGGRRVLFYRERLVNIDGELLPGVVVTDMWNDIPIEGIAGEGGVELKRGKKPEVLILRLFDMVTNEDDIVMDFNLGSGTTAAVAHKMGRHYIGVEQLDYGENDSVQRLKNVIAGDSTGVSKAVGWQGGGSFIYCELMQWNERFVQRILAAPGKAVLQAIWDEMRQKAHLSFRLDVAQFDAHAAEFADLSLEDGRRFLMEVLDKNQLYVNYSEMDDQTYGVSEEDKRLNRLFYGG